MGRVGRKGVTSTRRRKTSTKKSPNQKRTHPSLGRPATINDLPVETLVELISAKSSTPFSASLDRPA
ncbi:hypothetical protein BS47DRAFT_1342907 [Hydnum rufescens UP504]|uniref:Uncharacterized protein n=1 Tax=Hydnum rufescens UP504 TaxID=1448309 RepID=A0A9P6AZ95_9AGAM|nr:hypothetical protein BS47DRAFT_1342907 [Hydnum rufescens UP504]